MATSIEELKSYFETADKPTQVQFARLIDAFFHKDSMIPMESVLGLIEALNALTSVVNWGDIDGNINDQTDLINKFAEYLALAKVESGLEIDVDTLKLGGLLTRDTEVSTEGFFVRIGDSDAFLMISPSGTIGGVCQLMRNNGSGLHIEDWQTKISAASDFYKVNLDPLNQLHEIFAIGGKYRYLTGAAPLDINADLITANHQQQYKNDTGVIQLEDYLGTKKLSYLALYPSLTESGKVLTWDHVGNYWQPSTPTAQVLTNRTIYVCATNGTDSRASFNKYDVSKPFLTIQSAVTAAASGDTILIRPGVYSQSVTVPNTIATLSFILDRVTWAGVGTASTLTVVASTQVNIHMIDSVIQNTGDGTSVTTAQNTATINANCVLIITTNQGEYNPIIANVNTVTLGTGFRAFYNNKIISTNANCLNCNASWSASLNVEGVYLETAGANAMCVYFLSGAMINRSFLQSINNSGLVFYQGKGIIKNCIILSKKTVLPQWSNGTNIVSDSYLYSNDEYIFGGEVSNGGGNSSTYTRLVRNCVLNSFKRTFNYVSGGVGIGVKLQFEGNRVTVRDTANFTFAINKSAWDVSGSTVSSFSTLLAFNNVSNVQLVQTHNFVNAYHVSEEFNNIESSNYIAFNNL